MMIALPLLLIGAGCNTVQPIIEDPVEMPVEEVESDTSEVMDETDTVEEEVTNTEEVQEEVVEEIEDPVPEPIATPEPEPEPESPGLTMAAVAQNSSASSCWSVINGNVYDLTNWINGHPGGSSHILSICGTDGSSAFNGKHGGQGGPASTLSSFLLGPLE